MAAIVPLGRPPRGKRAWEVVAKSAVASRPAGSVGLLVVLALVPRQSEAQQYERGSTAWLDNLVTVATTGDDPKTRIRAVWTLLFAGNRNSPPNFAGVVARASRIYWATSDSFSKDGMLRLMAVQAERAAAAAFFAEVVTREPGHPDGEAWVMEFDELGSGTLPMLAVWGLEGLGPTGDSVLRVLATDSTIPDAHARSLLRRWRPPADQISKPVDDTSGTVFDGDTGPRVDAKQPNTILNWAGARRSGVRSRGRAPMLLGDGAAAQFRAAPAS